MGEQVLISGAAGPTTFGTKGTEAVVDPTFGALRVILKPDEFNYQGFTGGHFRAATTTGALTGVAAAGAIFSARWQAPGAPNTYMLLKRIQIAMAITTAFTTAQAVDFDVVVDRAFTVADSGGTALTPFTGSNQKVRAGIHNTSQVNDMRVATTAALTAGTKTADASPFGITCLPNTNAIGTGTQLVDLYAQNLFGQHPVMLGPGEGFNVRSVTAMGAVGVIKVYFVVEWAEVPGL